MNQENNIIEYLIYPDLEMYDKKLHLYSDCALGLSPQREFVKTQLRTYRYLNLEENLYKASFNYEVKIAQKHVHEVMYWQYRRTRDLT